jgi:DNA-binding NarL/FixJ family response regulator
VRVVIAEDSVLLRDGLVRLLAEDGHEVAAVAGDAAELVAAVERERPDAVVADVRMPPTHTDEGIRAAVELRQRHPGLPVLVLSQYVEERYASELFAGGTAGGVGYLLKDRVTDVRAFLDALRRVAEGESVVDGEVVAQLVARSRATSPLDELSPRESEVLALMAEGLSNAAIAQRLVITERAVEKHVRSIFQKLRLPPDETGNRRVIAVLRFLESAR